MEYLKVSMSTAISLLYEKRYDKPLIAKVLGVTPLQVYYYHIGKTKIPKPDICKKLLDGFTISGKQLLLDFYTDPEDLDQHLSMYNEA